MSSCIFRVPSGRYLPCRNDLVVCILVVLIVVVFPLLGENSPQEKHLVEPSVLTDKASELPHVGQG